MTADRWSRCPRCAKRRAKALAAREAEVSASYGKIPVEEFDAARAALDAERAVTVEPTLREDWDLWIEDGAAFIQYAADCQVCGLTYTFSHDDPIDTDGAA